MNSTVGIRAKERKELKEEFKGGSCQKTYTRGACFRIGDGFGKNSRVYAQIACKSRQEAR